MGSELLGGHRRANFIGAPEALNLKLACTVINEAFGICTYLVGSAITKRDYRDVDLRCMLDDAEFDRIFGRTTNPRILI